MRIILAAAFVFGAMAAAQALNGPVLIDDDPTTTGCCDDDEATSGVYPFNQYPDQFWDDLPSLGRIDAVCTDEIDRCGRLLALGKTLQEKARLYRAQHFLNVPVLKASGFDFD